MLDGFGAYEEKQDKRHDQKYEAERQRRIVRALGKLEEVTQASSCCNELPNDGTRKSKADRHLEAAEHPCRDRGNIDLTQQDHTATAKGPHAVDQQLIDILDTAVDGEEYKHRNEDYRRAIFEGSSIPSQITNSGASMTEESRSVAS